MKYRITQLNFRKIMKLFGIRMSQTLCGTYLYIKKLTVRVTRKFN